MKTFLKFSTIVILLLVLIGISIAGIIGHQIYSEKGATITFINNSTQTVDLVMIEVSGKSCTAKGLENGGTFNCRLENLSDSGFNVQVSLRNGKSFSVKDQGYVTGGMDFNEKITINENGELKFISPGT